MRPPIDIEKISKQGAEAKRRASVYAPEPNVEPERAGCMSALGALFVMMLAGVLSGADLGYWPPIITIVVFGAGAYAHYMHQRTRYDRAYQDELRKIREEDK